MDGQTDTWIYGPWRDTDNFTSTFKQVNLKVKVCYGITDSVFMEFLLGTYNFIILCDFILHKKLQNFCYRRMGLATSPVYCMVLVISRFLFKGIRYSRAELRETRSSKSSCSSFTMLTLAKLFQPWVLKILILKIWILIPNRGAFGIKKIMLRVWHMGGLRYYY